MGKATDRIFFNARVWTGFNSGWVEALAVQDGRILSAGSTPNVEARIDASFDRVNLGGCTVVPGFIDGHTHFYLSAFAMQRVDLRDAGSREEFTRRIAEQARALPREWITEGCWDHELWGGELPHRDWIDASTPDTPVMVVRLDRHMALANSAALSLAGIDESTSAPRGGEIHRDNEGRVSGILKDSAMYLVSSVIPAPTEQQVDDAFQAAMDFALSHGVTQVHDMGLWEHLEIFQRAHARGKLRLRVYEFTPLTYTKKLAEYIREHGSGDDWLRWGGVKAFVDGSLGSSTACFYEPYVTDPNNTGLTMWDQEDLKEKIAEADRLGLQAAVHAIGDRANDILLDIFEAVAAINGPRDRRFRIEHAQHLSPCAFKRFARLGVIPSMQPYHAIDDGRWAERQIGPDRIKRTYAFGSLLRAGAKVVFGSDWDVAPIIPMKGIYAAVTRRTTDGKNPEGWVPEEKLTVAEALRAYTESAAWAGFQEDRLGHLAPGYLADFVVLSDDPFAVDTARLSENRVLRTVIGGRDAYIADV